MNVMLIELYWILLLKTMKWRKNYSSFLGLPVPRDKLQYEPLKTSRIGYVHRSLFSNYNTFKPRTNCSKQTNNCCFYHTAPWPCEVSLSVKIISAQTQTKYTSNKVIYLTYYNSLVKPVHCTTTLMYWPTCLKVCPRNWLHWTCQE